MGHSGIVVAVLALASVVSATVADNAIDGEKRVVLVAPVLAPPRDSRKHVTDRSRQFPILVLLAQQHPESRPAPKSLNRNPQPIYVKTLEDQERERSAGNLNRQKRTLLKKHLFGFGGGLGGGGISFGYGGGGYNGGYGGHSGYEGGYEVPSKTIIFVKEPGHGHGHHHGGYHHHGGGYEGGSNYGGGNYNPGYGNGGGYGGGFGGGGGYGGGFGGGYGGGGVYDGSPGGFGGQGGYQQPSGGCGSGCGGNYGNYGGGSYATATATATAQASSSGYGKR